MEAGGGVKSFSTTFPKIEYNIKLFQNTKGEEIMGFSPYVDVAVPHDPDKDHNEAIVKPNNDVDSYYADTTWKTCGCHVASH